MSFNYYPSVNIQSEQLADPGLNSLFRYELEICALKPITVFVYKSFLDISYLLGRTKEKCQLEFTSKLSVSLEGCCWVNIKDASKVTQYIK